MILLFFCVECIRAEHEVSVHSGEQQLCKARSGSAPWGSESFVCSTSPTTQCFIGESGTAHRFGILVLVLMCVSVFGCRCLCLCLWYDVVCSASLTVQHLIVHRPYDMIWYDMIWYDMIWYDWYDMICYDINDMIWYDMMWCDMIWLMIWLMIWYDMISLWYDVMI